MTADLRVRPPSAPAPASVELAVWRLNLLRVGYLVIGAGLAVTRWPALFHHDPWELKQGTVECMLLALSLLALLGLRHPRKMIPLLLFEVAWKVAWLSIVALPLWLDGNLDGDTAVQAATVLWVVVPIAVVPWRHVLAKYLSAPSEAWRRREVMSERLRESSSPRAPEPGW